MLDFIPRVAPKTEDWDPPAHLAPLVDAIESVDRGSTIRLAVSVPPRHYKTTTILAGLVWLLERNPGFRVAYLTYNQAQADRKSREALRFMGRAGIEFGDRVTYEEWETGNGGLFRAVGLIGGVTGDGFDLIIVDDPYRKRQDAESRLIQKRTIECFEADVFTRQGNKPTSFIICHTRWTTQDLIQHVTHEDFQDGRPFDYMNLPAIDEDGEALCPKYWPVERLKPFMSNPYEWSSQFMGQPRPPGTELFGPATTCRLADVPDHGRSAIGIDLAYTAKTHADSSVSLVLRQSGSKFYVADVQKRQVQAPEFAQVIKLHQKRNRGAPTWWYCSGVEKGSADFMRELGVPIKALNATTDKKVRALPASAAWNAGEIVVPDDAPWSRDFLETVTNFTGIGDIHDDEVDALAAAYDALANTTEHITYQGYRRPEISGIRTPF